MCDASNLLGMGALGMQAAGVGVSSVAAYQKAEMDKTAYTMQAQVAETNAQLDEFRAADAITRGKTTLGKHQLSVRQMVGTQRAQLAANGLTLDSGSPLNILSDTEFMGARDAEIIKSNALKEAWGYKVQAVNDRNAASMLRYRAGMSDPGSAAATTALTGAGSVAASWYNMGKSGVGLS